MDARERDAPQSFRPINKRPWEADSIPRENANSWNGARLPPIDTLPYKRSSIADGANQPEIGEAYVPFSRPGSRDSTPKRARLEGSSTYNNVLSWEIPPPSAIPAQLPRKSPILHHTHSTGRVPALSYDRPSSSRSKLPESMSSKDISYLCRQCRRTIQDEENGGPGESDRCEPCNRNPELAYVTQTAAAGLTQLEETLRMYKSSELRGIVSGSEQWGLGALDYPPIAQSGLKASLSWILGKINQMNKFADKLVEHVPSEALSKLEKELLTDVSPAPDGSDTMKRRMLPESEERSGKGADSGFSTTSQPRRRSSMAGMAANDELSSMRPRSPIRMGISPTMNPPPTPHRQLPSPPGRQLPSPTSHNFPSPRASPYPSSQSTNASQGSQQPTGGTTLPSISAGLSGESAIQAHSAALQHEVSIQKIALSSLQGEHDKLLSALSRSQTRAGALEKKHAVSDGEIISLTEEKIRLQQQVTELERDIEDVSRSRDAFRQAAVQEGAQYLEIVQKASRLEEIAAEERKTWKVHKAEMEQEIKSLKKGRDQVDGSISEVYPSVMQFAQSTPPPSIEARMKVEVGTEDHFAGDAASSIEGFQEELQRLRSRCTKAEDTLRAVRADTARIVGSLSTAGKEILERVDGLLKNEEPQSGRNE